MIKSLKIKLEKDSNPHHDSTHKVQYLYKYLILESEYPFKEFSSDTTDYLKITARVVEDRLIEPNTIFDNERDIIGEFELESSEKIFDMSNHFHLLQQLNNDRSLIPFVMLVIEASGASWDYAMWRLYEKFLKPKETKI